MWITETAVPPMIICSTLAVILFIRWHLRRQRKYMIGGLLMVVLLIGFYFLELRIVTEDERVEADLYALVDAFEKKDAEKTLSYISLRAKQLRVKAKMALAVLTIDGDLRITDVQTALKLENSVATTHFRANGAATLMGMAGHRPTRWELIWHKVDDEWKVTKAQMLDPISGGAAESPVPK